MEPIRPAASMPSVSIASAMPTRTMVETAPTMDVATNETVASRSLDPAVSVDVKAEVAEPLPSEVEQRAYVRDTDNKSLVFRVTNSQTGEVLLQIPDELILKARAYARESTSVAGMHLTKTA